MTALYQPFSHFHAHVAVLSVTYLCPHNIRKCQKPTLVYLPSFTVWLRETLLTWPTHLKEFWGDCDHWRSQFSSSSLTNSPMIGVKDILMNVRVHFRGPCPVQTTGVAHLMGLPNPPSTLSSPPLSPCSRGLRRLINVNVFSLLKPIRCTLFGHAQQNITLFRRTTAPSLPSMTPQQSHLSKSRGRLAFGRDWPSG